MTTQLFISFSHKRKISMGVKKFISFPKDFFKVPAATHQHDDADTRAFGTETPQRAFLECGTGSLLILFLIVNNVQSIIRTAISCLSESI